MLLPYLQSLVSARRREYKIPRRQRWERRPLKSEFGSIQVFGKLPTYPFPKPNYHLLLDQGKMLAQGRGRWAVSQKPELISEFYNTVEPLHNSHLGDRKKWPLQRGLSNSQCTMYGLSAKKVAIVKRWPLLEV